MFIGREIIELPLVDSTNSFAARLLSAKRVTEGTTIIASQQLAGKGYSGNFWESDPGMNLLISIILYPSFLSPRHAFFLNQVVSLALVSTAENFVRDASIQIKWPNDILLNGKKVAGILIENSIQGQTLQHSIIGIGLNVNQTTFSSSLPHAGSFREFRGNECSLREIREYLFSELERNYLQLKSGQIEWLQKNYMKRLFLVEEVALFSANGSSFTGKIVGLTSEGKLIIENEGVHKVFGFKEVEFLRHQ